MPGFIFCSPRSLPTFAQALVHSLTISLDLARSRVDALYRGDRGGRLLGINQWNGGAAPRFFVMRTLAGTVCRFRADLPADLVRCLENLCEDEPSGEVLERLPFWRDRYLTLLSSHAPIDRVWAGPVYMVSQDVAPVIGPVAIDTSNAELLRGGLDEWLPDVPYRRPFLAIVVDERAVSLCASVGISDAVHCAGVQTRTEYRRRGHAADAVAGWARAVRKLGATPFYSTSWDNIASQSVANRLRLSLVGVDFHVN